MKQENLTEMKQRENLPEAECQLMGQKISDAIGAGLAEKPLDRAIFDAWMREAQRKKLSRRRHYMMAAACMLVFCVGITVLTGLPKIEKPYAIAGNNGAVKNQEQEGVVTKNNSVGAEENPGGERVTVTDWKQVEPLKKEYPDLQIPDYIPEGYAFIELTVENNDNAKKYWYTFQNKEDVIWIKQMEGLTVSIFYEYERQAESNAGPVYFKNDGIENAGIQKGEQMIMVSGEISDEELIRILESLK